MTTFDARPKSHHGRQGGTTVTLDRPRETCVTLPRTMNASPIPQGSNGNAGLAEVPTPQLNLYGQNLYGAGDYGR
jgi:hypothetical protein